jgi:D-arabinose 1-dehydrogenase-like Zn-dependent alcohol dehydrogenase
MTGTLGVTASGGFAEYFVAPANNVFLLPGNVGFDVGGLACCAVVTAVHAFRRAGVELGDTAAVVGSGGVAQPLIQILKAAGARVVAISRSEEKLAIARELGADVAVNAGSPDLQASVRELTEGVGASCVFDCVGSSQTMRDSAALVRSGGRIVVVGEEADYPAIDTIQIAQRELEIVGSRNGPRQDFVRSIAMLASGVVAPPIAQTFALEEINDALELLRSGHAHARLIVRT